MWVVLRPIPTKLEGDGSLFESKILVKSTKPRFKAQRKVDNKNYDAIIMSRNYYRKLLQEIITGNYHRKLSASKYHQAKNVGIIGILAYPKIFLPILGSLGSTSSTPTISAPTTILTLKGYPFHFFSYPPPAPPPSSSTLGF